VPESFARTLLDAGRLTTVLEDWCPWIPGLALYYPRNALVPATLRAFIDVVKQAREVPSGGPSGSASVAAKIAAKKPPRAGRSKRAGAR
jgi:hypothetical protein